MFHQKGANKQHRKKKSKLTRILGKVFQEIIHLSAPVIGKVDID